MIAAPAISRPPVLGERIARFILERETARPGGAHLFPRDLRAEACALARAGMLRRATAWDFYRVTEAGLLAAEEAAAG